jgi:hypothetical protein
LALATAVYKEGRNDPTPNFDITHSRRAVTTRRARWATIVDSKDKLENIHSPESEYAQAGMSALGRLMDDAIIAASLGTAYTGETGTTTQSLGTAQKVVPVSGGVQTKLNVQALRYVVQLFDAAEVPNENRYFVFSAASKNALLGQTEVSSSDYNTVKALVQGEINSFLGMQFIHSERLPLASVYSSGHVFNTTTGLYDAGGTAINSDSISNFAFVGDGVILGMNEGSKSRISEREDLDYGMQVYTSMDFGAVRMEEAKVVEVICRA